MAKEPDIERAQRMADRLDRFDAGTATAIRKVAQEHRRAYIERVRPAPNRDAERVAEDAIRAEFLPKYRQTVEERIESLWKEGAQFAIKKELGLDISAEPELGDLGEIIVDDTAETAFSEAHDWYREQHRAEVQAGKPQQIKANAKSTFQKIARRGSSQAWQQSKVEGVRVVEPILNEIAPGGRLIAVRIAVMDSNTCSVCEGLNGREFKFGSATYQRSLPPNGCEGGLKCRCDMQYFLETSS